MNHVLRHGAPASAIRKHMGGQPESVPKVRAAPCAYPMTMMKPAPWPVTELMARSPASALMFTLDGVPLLYNGMEVGDATESGDPALFDKLNIFWHPKDRPPLARIYHDLIRLRKDYPAFTNDRLTWLPNSDESRIVSFERTDATDEFVVVINLSDRPMTGSLQLLNAAGFKPVKISGMPDSPAGNLPRFQLDGFGWRIYHRSVVNPRPKTDS